MLSRSLCDGVSRSLCDEVFGVQPNHPLFYPGVEDSALC